MSAKTSQPAPAEAAKKLHLVCGSGGTRAFLSGAGAISAFDFAGLNDWETIGGVSGGSIPTLLLASGATPARIVAQAIDIDFSRLLVQTDTLSHAIKTRLRLRRRTLRRVREGLVSSHGLGRLLEHVVREWPKNYWTMAVSGNSLFVFTADGVFEYVNGQRRIISRKPAPIGLAIRASCAVPGIIEAIEYQGRHLFDGALSQFGNCPTGMVDLHFGASTNDVVAVDLARYAKRRDRLFMLIGRLISGTIGQRRRREEEDLIDAGLVVRPEVNGFQSLDFSLTREQKQEAVLSGFRATVASLEKSGILAGEKLAQARLACQSFSAFEQLCLSPAEEHPQKRSLLRRLFRR